MTVLPWIRSRGSPTRVELGLRANWEQFALLVAINAFVGGMVGIERSILPLLARDEFGIASKTATVSFVAAFGLAKALANLLAGHLSQRSSRRNLLVAGWLFGLPVPFVLIFAPSWGWVIAANALLGLNQGLTWSMTVNMKIDLVGPSRRGLALGLNEAAGYLSVAVAAFATGIIAEAYGLRPEPFYLGIAIAALGLALSVLFVRDTKPFVQLESAVHAGEPRASLWHAFAETTWRRRHLFGISQAGFVNNLNDGLAWGILPLFFAARGLSLDRIALLAAVYPLIWAALQLVTGWASDSLGRKPLIVSGMLLQGVGLTVLGEGNAFPAWIGGVILLGLGTALVYPTLLAAIGDAVHPGERSTSLGVYRFWRDTGAAAGALVGGGIADVFGLEAAVMVVAGLTLASGVVAAITIRGRVTGRELREMEGAR